MIDRAAVLPAPIRGAEMLFPAFVPRSLDGGPTFSPRRPGGASVSFTLTFLSQVTPVSGVLLEKVRIQELDEEVFLFHT